VRSSRASTNRKSEFCCGAPRCSVAVARTASYITLIWSPADKLGIASVAGRFGLANGRDLKMSTESASTQRVPRASPGRDRQCRVDLNPLVKRRRINNLIVKVGVTRDPSHDSDGCDKFPPSVSTWDYRQRISRWKNGSALTNMIALLSRFVCQQLRFVARQSSGADEYILICRYSHNTDSRVPLISPVGVIFNA
jgi:hypothetical protein